MDALFDQLPPRCVSPCVQSTWPIEDVIALAAKYKCPKPVLTSHPFAVFVRNAIQGLHDLAQAENCEDYKIVAKCLQADPSITLALASAFVAADPDTTSPYSFTAKYSVWINAIHVQL